MNDTRRAELEELLKPMLKKIFYVSISRAIATSDEMLSHVAEHLRYMDNLEERGLLFASGPFVQEGAVVGDGLTILRTADLEEATQIMEHEPLIKRGMRRFEIRKWELREGRLTINLNASRSTFELG